jgi:hypothetical protein
MSTASLPLHCTVAASCGLLAHWLYFIHGEKDGKALRIIIAHLNGEVLLSAYLIRYLGISKAYLSFNAAINLCLFRSTFLQYRHLQIGLSSSAQFSWSTWSEDHEGLWAVDGQERQIY